MNRFWMVWNEGNSDPRFKHMNRAAAEAEAERLARQFPGQRFIILESVAACKHNDIMWETWRTDDGPF